MPRKFDVNAISESEVNKKLSEPDLKTERIYLRVTPTVMTKLRDQASRREISISSLMNIIVSDWLEKNTSE